MGYREADTFTPIARHGARVRLLWDETGVTNTLASGVSTLITGEEVADTDTYVGATPVDRFTIPAGQGGLYLLTLNMGLSRVAGCVPAPCRLGVTLAGSGQKARARLVRSTGRLRIGCELLVSFAAGEVVQPFATAVGNGEPGGTVDPGGSPGGGNDGAPSYMTIVRLDT